MITLFFSKKLKKLFVITFILSKSKIGIEKSKCEFFNKFTNKGTL